MEHFDESTTEIWQFPDDMHRIQAALLQINGMYPEFVDDLLFTIATRATIDQITIDTQLTNQLLSGIHVVTPLLEMRLQQKPCSSRDLIPIITRNCCPAITQYKTYQKSLERSRQQSVRQKIGRIWRAPFPLN